jgi:hypothetical protein
MNNEQPYNTSQIEFLAIKAINKLTFFNDSQQYGVIGLGLSLNASYSGNSFINSLFTA